MISSPECEGEDFRYGTRRGTRGHWESPNDLFLPATRATAIARIEARWPDGVETSISNPQIENGQISIWP
jgi:hypothetical protein